MSGGKQGRRGAGGVPDRREAGQEGCRTGEMQDRKDKGKEGF